ncbi:rhamnan synthesis F family protein [Agarivorans sp. MS3-6]
MSYKSVIKHQYPLLYAFLRSVKKRIRSVKYYLKSIPTRIKYRGEADLGLLTLAKKHGHFDLDWYNDHQHSAFTSDEQAFADYLHKSMFSNVNPSPAFDTEIYQKCNVDIYHAGINPLAHYLNFGLNEGRISMPASPKWRPSDKLEQQQAISKKTDKKIALCFHIFYEDFIDYYAECLADFPGQVDIFISVSKEGIDTKAQQQLSQLTTVNKVVTAIVPNRGRNFGPMLVEFGKQLLNYDLLCHMHSKKSLYSGREQRQWADYLGEYLLKDQAVLKRMLAHFDNDPDCGIYYPTSFWMMPNWVNHWLKNKPHSGRWVTQWGLSLDRDFLAYPVGGMFWARPQALKQLFDADYSYDDFPAEPLPNDGSELHALERCIGLLAEKNGYKQLFYYPPLGAFTHDQSFVLANYVNSADGIANQLAPFTTVSFDVFDTLVRRKYFVPDYAKLKLANYLCEQGKIDNPKDFVKQRNNAELEVRKAKQFIGDVAIDETYQALASTFNWSEQLAAEYAELEFAFDLDMIESKDEMVEIANNLILSGKKVLVVSDTYYSEPQITRMLKKVGLSHGYHLYVSSELGLRKDNGSMWKKLKTQVGPADSFIHVGDNVVADAQIPGDFGLQNMHILNPLDKWQAAGWQNPFVDDGLDEKQIMKWGPLVSNFGRFPFLGE